MQTGREEIEFEAEQRYKRRIREALQKLEQADSGDPESSHAEGDAVLCELLSELGYEAVVERWHKIRKWYA